MSDIQMSQSGLTECPVCGRSFPLTSVIEHVDRCLAGAAETPATPENAANTSPNSSHTQQKSFYDVLKSSGSKSNVSGSEKALFRGQNSAKRGNRILAGKFKITPPPKKMKIETDMESETNRNTAFSRAGRTENCELTQGKDGKPQSVAVIHKRTKEDFKPLAERMRPKTLDEYVGQSKVLGKNSLLRTLLQAEEVPSMILWGPPGCGKVRWT